jgi:hypothetical protein
VSTLVDQWFGTYCTSENSHRETNKLASTLALRKLDTYVTNVCTQNHRNQLDATCTRETQHTVIGSSALRVCI